MTEYFEILIPHGRGKTWIYGRRTREDAFEFARDAKRKGHSPGIWHATTVAGRTGRESIPREEWDK